MMADHEDDSRWNYDCPQFVDFTLPMPFNDGADKMFEHTVIGEGPSSAALHTMQVAALTANPKSEIMQQEPKPQPPSTNPAPESEEKKVVQPAEISEDPPKKQLGNMVTSLEEWRSHGKHASSGPEGGSASKKPRKSAEKALNEICKSSSSKPSRKQSASVRMQINSSDSSLPGKASAQSSSTTDLWPMKNHTRDLSAGHARSNSVSEKDKDRSRTEKDTSKSERDASRAGKIPRLGPLAGPSFLKWQGEHSSSSKAKTTEELELERIEQLKKELQHKRRLAQQSYKKAMAKTAYVVPHSIKDPTLPQEFHFQTDTRVKPLAEDKKATEEKTVGDFVKTLRSRTVVSLANPSHSAAAKTLTVPQPFHLSEKSKSSTALNTMEGTKFESLAEKVTAFHRRTPERFRVRPRSLEKTKPERARSHSPPGLTIAHTPNLQARNRHRPVRVISQKELEEKEVEEMRKNQFKAHPVNTKILTNPNTGVKKVPSKAVTQPEEFHLSAGTCRDRSHKEEEEKHYEFHAQPVNKKILEGPVGLRLVAPALPTVPMSPAFALKHRVRLPVELPEEKPDPATGVIKAKPVPHTGIPFQPKLPHQHTVPEPFAVETRSKIMLAQKEEKIRQALEEERRAREFHAQPLPCLDPGELPPKMLKESTKPEPFQLKTEVRGSRYTQELAHKIAEEEDELRKAAEFHAQPNRNKDKKPFVPARSTKPLTEVSDFELNTDRRAVQREEFELRKKEHEAELEGQKRLREQRQKEEEEVAIAKLRAEMVHQPNPIRRYPPIVIKPSDKPLTDAESPQFSERLRAKVRLL